MLDDHNVRKAEREADIARGSLARLALKVLIAKVGGWSKQPRVPSGPKGGQWTAGGGFGGGIAPQGQVKAPHLGQGGEAARRYREAPETSAFTRPLTESEITGQPAFLGNPAGFILKHPSEPSDPRGNGNPEDVATYTSDAHPGDGLNGLAFKEWAGPAGGDWSKVDGTGSFDEPPPPHLPPGMRLGAGVVIEEPDGRIWTVNPLNQFGGYAETFPKGGIEKGLDLRQTAIKEAFEESGLKVELTGHLADVRRTTSVARYYRARRVGGDPTKFHWETQATNAVPLTELGDRVLHHADAPILAALKGEPAAVQKGLCKLADLIDAREILAKGGGWSKQPRVPSGPKGGQWTTGSWFGGAAGVPGDIPSLKAITAKNMDHPQVVKYNADIKAIQAQIADGQLSPATVKLAASAEPTSTYKKKVWAAAKEAVAYMQQKAAFPEPPTPVKAAAPIPGFAAALGTLPDKPAGTAKDPLKLADMTYFSAMSGGSSQKGVYKDADGQKWLVKSYSSSGMAQNEVAAARLYNAMGVTTPEMHLIDTGGAMKGGLAVASKFMDDLTPLDTGNPAHMAAAQAQFATHAFLSNWDAVGLAYDNMMMDSKGNMVMVDPGGSLAYRAQGAKKGDLFKTEVTEFDSLRNPAINVQTAKVFGPMTQSALAESAVKTVDAFDAINTNLTVAKVLGDYIGGEAAAELHVKLDARAADLIKKATAIQAAEASTTAIDGAKTGLEKVPTPADLGTATQSSLKVITANIEFNKDILAAQHAAINEKGAAYYHPAIDALAAHAAAGDVDGVVAAKLPTPKTKSAQNGPNWAAYEKAHQAALSVAKNVQAKAAADLKPQASLDGSLITGQLNKTTGDVAASMKAAKDAPGSVAQAKAEAALMQPSPTPVAPQPSPTPLPGIPKKPVLFSPANKNASLVELADKAEHLIKTGGPEAIPELKAMVAFAKGPPSYKKKFEKYIADGVAALGGDAAAATLSAATKKAATAKGIASAADAITTKTTAGVKITKVDKGDYFTVTTVTPPAFDAQKLSPPNPINKSSHAAINADNTKNVQALHAAALTGDAKNVMALDISMANGGVVNGSTVNQHVEAYKKKLLAELAEMKKPHVKEHTEWKPGKEPTTYAEVAIQADAEFKQAKPFDPKLKKFGGWLHHGTIDQPVDVLAKHWTGSQLTTAEAQKLYVEANANISASGIDKKTVKSFTGSGSSSINYALWNYAPGSADREKVAKNAREVVKKMHDLPEGMTMRRGITFSKGSEIYNSLANLKPGDVIQDQGFSSTSWKTNGGFSGNIHIHYIAAKGSKGLFVDRSPTGQGGPLSSVGNGSEHEIVLPPNNRMVVLGVNKAGEKKNDSFGESFPKVGSDTMVLEVLLLPTDLNGEI